MSAASKVDHSRCGAGRWTIAAFAALFLTGCADDRLPAAGPAEFASEPMRMGHELRFAEDSETLSPVDLERLSRFLDASDPKGDDDVVVTIGPDQGARVMHLQALLLSEGRRASIAVDPAQPEGRAVLSIERQLVVPTRCTGEGLWDSDIAEGSEGLPIGCTTSMNLSAMIDNPEDLARGRPLGPAAAAPAADLARAYLSRFADPVPDIHGLPIRDGDADPGRSPGAADASDGGAMPHLPPGPAQGQ